MTIVIDGPTITGAIGFAVGVGVSAAAAWARLRKVMGPARALIAWFEEFRQDWSGVPDRAGVPGRHGVMLRLSTIEGELKTNGGQSLRDAVKRTEKAVAEIRAQVNQATVIALPGAAAQPAAGALESKDEAA